MGKETRELAEKEGSALGMRNPDRVRELGRRNQRPQWTPAPMRAPWYPRDDAECDSLLLFLLQLVVSALLIL